MNNSEETALPLPTPEDTKYFPFEATRVCMSCGKTRTLSFYGRLSLESWIRVLLSQMAQDFICEMCGGNDKETVTQPAN